MPKRKQTVQAWTREAQGADSWVEFIPVTVEESLGLVPNSMRSEDETRLDELRNRVLRWNWVDVEGNPLPQPEEDPDVWNSCTAAELAILSRIVLGMPTADELKN